MNALKIEQVYFSSDQKEKKHTHITIRPKIGFDIVAEFKSPALKKTFGARIIYYSFYSNIHSNALLNVCMEFKMHFYFKGPID